MHLLKVIAAECLSPFVEHHFIIQASLVIGHSSLLRMHSIVIVLTLSLFAFSCDEKKPVALPDVQQLSKHYFGNDANWYVENIPFFECSDKQIEAVYYYRWQLYKAHIRNVGQNEYVITEFINDVHWDRDPYSTINAASGHHIYEGRWLKDDRYMNSYIDYLNRRGGNTRSYSEWIGDASYARYLVNGDSAFITSQLDSLVAIYKKWSDHYDSTKAMYFIPAMPDATEYTIASIDASGGKAGFDGGDAFRPTFNSYMYGNANAIARIAALKTGNIMLSEEFVARRDVLRNLIQNNLWNDSLHHFLDRFKQDNAYVHYWDFIRGRELAGMIPWYFNLPESSEKYNEAWRHVLDSTQLLGAYGLRTNEPSYEYYFKQFVYNFGRRGSQWNGPSWPFQSSLALTGMANFLNNYKQSVVTNSDYLKLLRRFTQQHYLPDGKINLVENYDPNHGGPIVHFYWSNHYNHSSYNDLVISGLCGIRPSPGDSLVINPLVDESIDYFALKGVRYHGHLLDVIYDRYGDHYHTGKGLSVWVDGAKKEISKRKDGSHVVHIGKLKTNVVTDHARNLSLNITRNGYPTPSASVNNLGDSLYQAIDGRIWYFPEISNRWTTEGSTSEKDWFAIDFGEARSVSQVDIYPFVDDNRFAIPPAMVIEYKSGKEWIRADHDPKVALVGNTKNSIRFTPFKATEVRIQFIHPEKNVAMSEIEFH